MSYATGQWNSYTESSGKAYLGEPGLYLGMDGLALGGPYSVVQMTGEWSDTTEATGVFTDETGAATGEWSAEEAI